MKGNQTFKRAVEAQRHKQGVQKQLRREAEITRRKEAERAQEAQEAHDRELDDFDLSGLKNLTM